MIQVGVIVQPLCSGKVAGLTKLFADTASPTPSGSITGPCSLTERDRSDKWDSHLSLLHFDLLGKKIGVFAEGDEADKSPYLY